MFRKMKVSPRSQKLAGVIQEKITPIIQQFLSPDEIGFCTVTAVEISGDLEWAHVFLTSMGGKKDWLTRLNGLAPKISYELSRKVELRRALKIIFKEDKGLQNQSSIFN